MTSVADVANVIPGLPIVVRQSQAASQRAIPPASHKAEEEMSDLITWDAIVRQINFGGRSLRCTCGRACREDGVRLVRCGLNRQASGLRKQ